MFGEVTTRASLECRRGVLGDVPDLRRPQSTNLAATDAVLRRCAVFVVSTLGDGLKAPVRPFQINYFSFSVEQIKGGSEETLIT